MTTKIKKEKDPDKKFVELIAAVKDCPMLWDLQSIDFKNVEKKRRKWAEISEQLDIGGFTIIA